MPTKRNIKHSLWSLSLSLFLSFCLLVFSSFCVFVFLCFCVFVFLSFFSFQPFKEEIDQNRLHCFNFFSNLLPRFFNFFSIKFYFFSIFSPLTKINYFSNFCSPFFVYPFLLSFNFLSIFFIFLKSFLIFFIFFLSRLFNFFSPFFDLFFFNFLQLFSFFFRQLIFLTNFLKGLNSQKSLFVSKF